jgi:hypothetical protein
MTHISVVFIGVGIAMVLVVGATVAYLPLATVPTTTSTSTHQNTGESGSKDGLVLGAGVNASVLSPGSALSIQVWEKNTLDSVNNVSASNDWPVTGLSLGPCGTFSMPFGIEVLAGYHTGASQNLSLIQGVQYYQPGVFFCPVILNPGWYLFGPQSTDATLGGFCSPEPCGTSSRLNTTVTITGEYVGGSPSPTPLAPGLYTVVVGDEWGALLFLYFSVPSSGHGGTVLIPAGTNITVSSSYDCVASNFQLSFAVGNSSVLTGGFTAGDQGVTLYVATTQQASNLSEGHPSQWVYSTGLQGSATFSVSLSQGNFVIWIEGADLNCGAQIVMPLEVLTHVNITQSFTLTPA